MFKSYKSKYMNWVINLPGKCKGSISRVTVGSSLGPKFVYRSLEHTLCWSA